MMNRMVFLDILRMTMVLAAIVCGAVSNYAAFPLLTPYVPALEGQHWIGADIVYSAVSSVSIGVIFFLSAYFGASSLRMHMPKPYWQEKWRRLGWPFLCCALIFTPELAYITSLSHPQSTAVSVLSACIQGPAYFLGLLLLFHGLMACGKMKWHHMMQRHPASAPSALFLAVFWLIQCCVPAGILLLLKGHMESALIFLLYRSVCCAVYFYLGVYAFRHRWFTRGGYTPSEGASLPAAVIAAGLYLLGTYLLSGTEPEHMIPYLLPAWSSILPLPVLMALLAVFSRAVSAAGQKTTLLIKLAYPLYVVSDILLQNAAYVLRPLALPAVCMFLLPLALALGYGAMLCKYGLQYLPCFKKL